MVKEYTKFEIPKKVYGKAKAILTDKEKINNLLQKVNKLELSNFSGVFEYIPICCSLIKSCGKGEYIIPKKTYFAVGVALLYLLKHNDLIPDSIPILGLVDDAFVWTWCTRIITVECDKYQEWKQGYGTSDMELQVI